MKRYVVALSVCFGLALSMSGFAQGKKADVCHQTGNGFQKINVSLNAVSSHRAHGDALPGEAVPGVPGYEFDASCAAVLAQPDFTAFYIRNNNSTISSPWDADMSVVENAAGDGFSAVTPRGGQKVGYGTNFFDNLQVNALDSVDWTRLSGPANLVAYLNIWVTDGSHSAIIASENDYRGTDFQTRTEWKVFETNTADLGWLCNTGPATRVNQYLLCNNSNATLADIPANVTILSPLAFPAPLIGTGAPRGGYGLNLIWGDTAANFVNGPYHLNNLSITVAGTTYFAQ
jgi:hypothetical protein